MSIVKVDYGALENATSQMQAISKGMDDRLAGLKGRLQQITWEGTDGEAYRQHQAKWDAALTDMNQVLHQIGAAVATARENYQNTEKANTGLWG